MKNENKSVKPIPQQLLLALSFVEGACVMVAELAGGKMLAPFFGSSLYVWASTLAITLGALTLGYYIGGEWSKLEQDKRKKRLFMVITIASAMVIIMPVWANMIMSKTIEMSFLSGMILSQILFLLPPIMGMGIVSPMIISLLAETRESGKAAGLVYAISTFGGVLATLLTGFWLVPILGIAIPCVVIGTMLFLLNIYVLRPQKKTAIAGLVAIIIPSAMFIYNTRHTDTDKYDVLYHSEGMLGQVKVMDFPYSLKGQVMKTRCMLVNHNWQTWVKTEDANFSMLFYTRFSKAIISTMPKDSKALLIGLGGGTVAKQLENHNVDYDAVEIDGRLPEIAERFFGLEHAVDNTTIDDGRHYVNVCKKKYDLIILDALLGDSVPSHLLSLECFNKLKDLLNPDGKIFIEFDGYEDGSEGVAQQLLYNTIVKAGYKCQPYTSFPGHTKTDIMYVATLGESNHYDTAQVVGDFYYPLSGPLSNFETVLNTTTTAFISDDYPVVDFYLKERVAGFRRDYTLKYYEDFLFEGVPFYK
ncbi:MAG: fused MFS/spermidine synthase [Chitinophagales bacterium]|nr:fused MFS/spermidine synthase [Chitinophagaceae bacterium]MCB9065611.1 fused MFS/spermidine synthase [Chitinophagales bacterium]